MSSEAESFSRANSDTELVSISRANSDLEVITPDSRRNSETEITTVISPMSSPRSESSDKLRKPRSSISRVDSMALSTDFNREDCIIRDGDFGMYIDNPAETNEILLFLDSSSFQFVMFWCTLYSLVIDDLRIWVFPKSYDDEVGISLLAIFCIFALELLLVTIYNPHYRFSWFWVLDLLSTLSIIPDVPYFWQPIGIALGITGSSSGDSATAARAARLSRIGARTGRILKALKVLRIKVRVARIAKLWDSFMRKLTAEESDEIAALNAEKNSSLGRGPKKVVRNRAMSKVGTLLADHTVRRVVVIILAMVFVIPIIQNSSISKTEKNGLNYLMFLSNDVSTTNATLSSEIENYRFFAPAPAWDLISLKLQGAYHSFFCDFKMIGDYRDDEIYAVVYDNYNFVIFSYRHENQLLGRSGFIVTWILILILGVGTAMFSADANELVIIPIERMISILESLKSNPFGRRSSDERNVQAIRIVTFVEVLNNYFANTSFGKFIGLKAWTSQDIQDKSKTAKVMFSTEIGILEKSLEKVTGLLQVGFGEAGSAIISKNIGHYGTLNAMVDGEKVCAIFGFCEIRGFEEITRCLQGDIFLFVNTIAEIVHSEVHRCDGAANKNMGESFLCVWKLPVETKYEDLLLMSSGAVDEIKRLSRRRKEAISLSRKLADKALAAFLRIYFRITSSTELAEYALHPDISQMFPNFKISLNFGLHVGWAIEGAIGSRFKIDASYLSPHVNLAARVNAATKQFGVNVLLSGGMHSLLSNTISTRCRLVDCVTVKGSAVPVHLYAVDISATYLESLRPNQLFFLKSRLTKKHTEHKNSAALVREDIANGGMVIDWQQDSQLSRFQFDFAPEFFSKFELGVKFYIDGLWEDARVPLQEVLLLNPEDVPCLRLIDFMNSYNFIAPEDWNGYRKMTAK